MKISHRWDVVYAYWIKTISPSIYDVKVRKGASKIELTCEWEGQGTVGFRLSTPDKTYGEDDLEVAERTVVSMNGLPRYQYVKKASLKVKPLQKEQSWTVQLNLCQVSNYRLSIDVS